ncbi:hypothetical protein [Halococcus sp. IIIV-5B]|nr:hypothetical protein [Halococcus sp. IIIV-5B]
MSSTPTSSDVTCPSCESNNVQIADTTADADESHYECLDCEEEFETSKSK